MTQLFEDYAKVPRKLIRHRRFSEEYWEGTRDQRLLLQYCKASGQYQHFPRPVSIVTGLPTLEWREVDGRGEIFSYSMTWRGCGPLQGSEPYLVVSVQLDVGVVIVSNLVGCSVDDVVVGMRVRPYWVPLENGTHLLLFQPN